MEALYEGAFDYEKVYITKNKIRYSTPEDLFFSTNRNRVGGTGHQ